MRKILTAATSALVFLFVGSAAVVAQDEEEGMTFIPVEAWACSFNEGKGPADLNDVNAQWNAWMDEVGATDYSAITIWPQFYGESNFDVGWLGIWPDGNAMGAGMDTFMSEGQEIGAKYGEVLTCAAHTQFATVRVRAPNEEDDDGDDSFVLTFSNCSFEEEATMDQLSAAQEEWNAYADEHGIVGGSWMMFPVWGENVDADYAFKAVSSAPSYTTMGANWAKMAEGHYRKSDELFEDILDCDSARVYTATVIRSAEESDE